MTEQDDPNSACAECGMANVSDEYHPAVLCRLVKAHGGDTAKARSDLAFVMGAARSPAPWTKQRVDTFMRNYAKEIT